MLAHTNRTASITILAVVGTFTTGCSDSGEGLTEPAALHTSQASADCRHLALEGTASLGLVEVSPGVYALGGLPAPVTIGGVAGTLGSIVTGFRPSGAEGQGAQHLTLIHSFISPQGTFTTSDRAVCAPAGTDAGTCRVNDVLTVVSGTGVFANAAGSMRNHGIIDLNTFTLAFSLRGRVCGDGL